MDITDYARPEIQGSISHPVTLPDGKTKTGLVLELCSMGDAAVKAVAHRHDGRVLRQSAGRSDISMDELDQIAGENWHERAFDMTCAVVRGWTWGEDEAGDPFRVKGEKWEYTRENVARLLTMFPFIASQAREQAERVANFLPKPASV